MDQPTVDFSQLPAAQGGKQRTYLVAALGALAVTLVALGVFAGISLGETHVSQSNVPIPLESESAKPSLPLYYRIERDRVRPSQTPFE